MNGFLARTIGFSLVAVIVLGWAIYIGVSWERDRRALDDANQRLNTLDTVKELEDEAENTSDDDLADSISDVPPGGR